MLTLMQTILGIFVLAVLENAMGKPFKWGSVLGR